MGGGGPVKAISQIAQGVVGITQQPKIKTNANVAPPAGPPKDLTLQELQGKAKGIDSTGSPPVFLGLSPQMTPLQQRTKIATMATQGQGAFTDPAAAQYYRQLALTNLIDMPFENITPVERQYVEQVLGEQIRKPTTESYLSALERGVSK